MDASLPYHPPQKYRWVNKAPAQIQFLRGRRPVRWLVRGGARTDGAVSLSCMSAHHYYHLLIIYGVNFYGVNFYGVKPYDVNF